MIESKLLEWTKEKDYRIAWADITILKDAEDRITGFIEEGTIDNSFAEHQFTGIFTSGKINMPNPKSVIVAAVSAPQYKLKIKWKNMDLETVIPPTYANYRRTTARVGKEVIDFLLEMGYSAEILEIPLKSIASMLGIVSYGRNNITYNADFGSHIQLVGLVTDIEFSIEKQKEKREMSLCSQCKSCKVCMNACPTGAINDSSFVIRADRCFTYYSENPGDWPQWLVPSLDECFLYQTSSLLGCMICQNVCPMNKKRMKPQCLNFTIENEETEYLIKNDSLGEDPIGRSLQEKLNLIDFERNVPILGRNLVEIIKNRFNLTAEQVISMSG